MVHRNGMAGRVNKEVNYHSKLNHTSIIKLYTYFEDANYVYLVLELAENGELKNFLKKNERVSASQFVNPHRIRLRQMTLIRIDFF